MASYIMFQGTGSHVGKSILTTALCRIFAREGMRTAPFKAQNMALNSYVTPDGKEMGRAQVAQAEAAGLIPETDMNPVLLKPVGNSRSQVIINGIPVGNMTAREYHLSYCMKAFDAVKSALARMDDTYDILVIEGGGSKSERYGYCEYACSQVFTGSRISRCRHRPGRISGGACRNLGIARAGRTGACQRACY